MLLVVILTSGLSKTVSNPISKNNLGGKGHTVFTTPDHHLKNCHLLRHGFQTPHHPRILVQPEGTLEVVLVNVSHLSSV